MPKIKILLLIIISLFGIFISKHNYYTPGDNIGYNLGLLGGIGMLTLLLYPLRKRFKLLNWSGKLSSWFNYHMFLGIFSPILILFHSKFQTESLNAQWALYSMLIVAFSGVIGRFIFRHTSQHLENKIIIATDSENILKEDFLQIGENLNQFKILAKELDDYKIYAFAEMPTYIQKTYRFMSLKTKGNKISNKFIFEINKNNIKDENINIENINKFIYDINKYSQIKVWNKLFSLWHLAHLPFVYLLIISGFIHVWAVHAY